MQVGWPTYSSPNKPGSGACPSLTPSPSNAFCQLWFPSPPQTFPVSSPHPLFFLSPDLGAGNVWGGDRIGPQVCAHCEVCGVTADLRTHVLPAVSP